MLAALLLLAVSYSLPTGAVESLLPAFAGRFMPVPESSASVAVVAIDRTTLDAWGDWPWPRSRLAKAIDRLLQFRPAAIGVFTPLSGRETPEKITDMREQLDQLPAAVRQQAKTWLQQLDTDGQLEQVLHKSSHVVLALPSQEGNHSASTVAQLAHLRLPVANADPSWQQVVQDVLFRAPPAPQADPALPPAAFLDAASAGIREVSMEHRYVSGVPLVFEMGGDYLPGFELALLMAARPETRAMVGRSAGLHLAPQEVTLPDRVLYPRPASPVPVYSLKQLMHDDAAARQLRNKILLLGVTATEPVVSGFDGRQYAPVGWSALALDSLLTGHALHMPAWFYALQRGLILLFAVYLLLLPSRWHEGRGAVLSALLAFLTLNAGVLLFILKAVWLPVLTPVLFLLGMQILLTLNSRRQAGRVQLRQQVLDARVALGDHLQAQGQLELALVQYQPCLPATIALEALYELGLEYERRRQMNRAGDIYKTLQAHAPGYRDVAQRAAQLASLAERFPGAGGAWLKQTLVLDNPVVELPRLGRYRLERELGRGAMGTVYLAEDPTIGRQVAIKTLPLQEYYEDGEQEQVAKRFLQEAEAVGRLSHPNIVAIHDAGQEHDLAYLTMDYVAGESLEAWVEKKNLLPVREVLEIAAQVADALDYAHASKVVHRDIKPGNILYDRDSGTVKITDFGVARILDNQRTRTGTVLGTPSYMSPEQVSGAKINGQSDLFSLGVTLYQLLTGSLPFEGDSVAALMYRIASQKMPPLRKQRGGLPVCVSRMVGRALQKKPGKRFASGADMAVTIRKCREQFRGGRRRTA